MSEGSIKNVDCGIFDEELSGIKARAGLGARESGNSGRTLGLPSQTKVLRFLMGGPECGPRPGLEHMMG